MARAYTNRSTAIWREDEFKSLTADEQHLLFLIESQPDISAAGTLPLTLRRWAALFRGGTVDGIRRTLAGLEAAGRVVVDEGTDELLLCSFIADDRGYGNRNRRPVILRAAADANSLPIRRALAREFRRFNLPTDGLALPPEPGGPEPSESRPETDETAEEDHPDESPDEAASGEKPQANRASDAPSDRASDGPLGFDGIVGCTATYLGSPTHNPHLSSRSPAPSGAAGLVANALGIDDDETREVIDQIRRLHKPRNLTGYVRTMAGNGDLAPILDDVRRARARTAQIAERRAQRAASPDPATEPPERPATPEEGAAARAFMRDLLAGRKTGSNSEPASFGAILGKASA